MSHSAEKRFGALPSASGTVTRLAFAQAKAMGCDAPSLLKKTGLTAEQINDPTTRLNVQDQIHFLNLASDAIHDDLLGFHLAQPVELRELGLLYYVMASSGSLGEAFQRCARYSSIVNEGVALKYDAGRQIRITLNYVGVSRHLDRHQAEFFAVTLIRIGRQLTGRRLVPMRVRFIHLRNKISSELLELLGKKIEFGASADQIAFGAPAACLPVVSADSYLNKLMLKYCEEALARQSTGFDAFRPKVENAIVALLPHGQARAAEVAHRLGLAQRTLARRLALEGVTFSEVLAGLKHDLGRRYLADKSLSISHVAWLLGYQEVSAFTHAFKRWTGQAPRATRSRLGASNG